MKSVTEFNFPKPEEFNPAKALRWGIIGTGGIVKKWAPTVQKNSNQIVQAVASKDLGRAESFAQEFNIPQFYGSYQELVEQKDLDAIYIASLPGEHMVHAILAMEHGKNVLIEKPLTLNIEEAKKIFEVATKNNVMAMEAMWTKYLPQMSVARKLVADGVIGEVELASATFCQNNRHVDRLWRFGAGSELIDMGIYPITFLHQFLGKPTKIQTQALIRDTGVDEEVMGIFQYGNQKQSNFTVSARLSMPTIASLSGTEGAISIGDPFFAPAPLTLHGNDLGDPGVRWEDKSDIRFHQGLVYQVRAFATYLEQGLTRSPIHGELDTLENLETTFEIARQLSIKFQ